MCQAESRGDASRPFIDNDRFNHPRSSDVNVKPSNSLSMHSAISNTLTCNVIRHPSGMLGIKSLKNMKRNFSPLAAHWRLHSICPTPFLGPVDHPCPPQLTLAALPARSPVSASCPWVCAPPRLAWDSSNFFPGRTVHLSYVHRQRLEVKAMGQSITKTIACRV